MESGRQYGWRHDQGRGLDYLAHQRPGGLAQRLDIGQPRGEVSSDRGQISVGPCGKRLTQPQIEFVLAQPSLHERHLAHADHLLAVSV